MSEITIQRKIQLECTDSDTRLFRNSVGQAWVGKAIHCANGDVILKRPMRVTFGLAPGSSDLVGPRSMIVTPDMVGRRVALFASIEVKTTTGRATDEQTAWIDTITSLGGIAGIARSVEDARKLLTG